ncbi:hypothetical protein Poli38472_002890 [Pythium oligandrum]|uniref:NAD-dependent epimerase/dehydratase domain-containing protein n=1 Tax=Pythium oligandrum TaxID=41045 RepID=A0A8K1C5S6_PYTOL|nr:hypothetical protein Poli38472_002890 [Pythium oligandrum]|eukprot:TMW56965.1 hypothetical protein Poli38472_002890 [Pythium oligandrum]
METKKLFVFGLGYSASRTARAFKQQGYAVFGTSRTVESAQELARQHPELFQATGATRNVFVFDGAHWDLTANGDVSVEQALAGTTHVIVSVPTGRVEGQEDPVLFALGEQLIQIVQPTLQWLAYLSTIGVYGETNGVAVDESAPVQSTVKRSQMRIAAEQQWLATGLPCHVFRIAGIYGPGRGTITKVRSGSATRIDLPGRLFNRIHVDDIVNILEASAAKPNPGAVYNVADDEPAPAEEVTAYACELLGVPAVPLQTWEEAEKTMSAMAKSFYAESKVVRNTRIKEELGVVLRYPTYREGLLAQLLEEEAQFDVSADAVADAAQGAEPLVVLANIGSLKPEPYLDLRQISFRLSRALRRPVVPCSFRFSNRIDPSLLHGMAAQTLEMVVTDYLQKKLAVRQDASLQVVILPLFFGNSTTLTEFLPSVLEKAWTKVVSPLSSVDAKLAAHVGRCLVDLEAPRDDRVAKILSEKVGLVLASEDRVKGDEHVTVLVLEHGTPNREVHDATAQVTRQLRALLPEDTIQRVGNACMERREGSQYDFNDPLLANAIDHYGITSGLVIIALLFFSQGRHAGEKGDIEEIVDDVKARYPHLDIRVTEPLGTHAFLSEILQDRYRQALQSPPTHVLPQ